MINSNRLNMNTKTTTGWKSTINFNWHLIPKKPGHFDELYRIIFRQKKKYYKFFEINFMELTETLSANQSHYENSIKFVFSDQAQITNV